ncbi:MAG: D-alanyl-D-alanine carboxypeptidase [Pseudomonadota bacterium]
MSFFLTRRGVLAAAASLLLAGCAAADAPPRAELPTPRPDAGGPGADALVQAAGLTGRVGYVLIDVATGQVLEARREAEAFPPASVAKAPTALFALETLGAEHRFETRLAVEGLGADGTAQRAVLVGGGDPELDSDALAEMAAQATARGLRRARIFAYDASGWPGSMRAISGPAEAS